MRKKLIAGNWKMNGTVASVRELTKALSQHSHEYNHLEMVVFPSFVFLPQVIADLKSSPISVGAQTLSEYAQGAYTGEVEGSMLKDVGCSMVLVGHSERRTLFHESSDTVAKKFMCAQGAGLRPVLCVGETLVEREAGSMPSVVLGQLDAVIHLAGIDSFMNAVIAYEPVWAIGTGRTATPEQAQEVHALIRRHLAKLNPTVAAKCQILYGGSVKPDNAVHLFAKPDIDGALIGGASLKAVDFLGICGGAVSV